MKAKFYLQHDVSESLLKKLDNIVELPCLPAKGMTVDISSFKEFELTKPEKKILQVEYITHIKLYSDYIEVQLDKIP